MGAHPTLLFTGASGLVGASLYRAALSKWRAFVVQHRRSAPSPLRRGDRIVRLELGEPGAARRLVGSLEPQAILHVAALASLPACEADPALAERLNAGATAELAAAAASMGAYFLHVSTDQVFDGARGRYRESDATAPTTIYGRTKLAGERAARSSGESLVLRAGLVLAPSADGKTGALDMIRGAGDREVRLFTDEWRTPISVLDLARVVDAALERRATGILHAAGRERVSRFELGETIAAAFPRVSSAAPLKLAPALQNESSHPRPRDVSLLTERLDAESWPAPAPLPQALAELAAFLRTMRRV